MKLVNVTYGEITAKSGSKMPGFILTAEVNGELKEKPFPNFGLQKNPELKNDILQLQSALKASSEPIYIRTEKNEKGYINRIYQITEQEAKTFENKASESETTKQQSIEKQNALNNATSLVASLPQRGDTDIHSLCAMIKDIAANLLQFHKQV